MAKLKTAISSCVHKNVSYHQLKCNREATYSQSSLPHEETSVNVSAENSKPKKCKRVRELGAWWGLIVYFLKKCWLTCSAAVFVIFVIYLCYGSIVALVLFVFAVSGFLFQIGDFFLYHPDQPPQSRLYVPLPSLFGLPYENVTLTTSDGVRIHAFFVKQGPTLVSRVPTVLYFHGNAGNVGHRLPNAQGLYQYCGFNILLVEYRGYGHSEGVQSEEGLYLDAQAGLQYLLQLPYIDKSKIIVFGRSLGGAVAIDLASHPKLGRHIFALMAENTFTSIPDIAREMFTWRFVGMLPVWAFKNQFFSLDKIKDVKRPSLFISGQADVVIPPRMMRMLLQACGSPMKRLLPFESGTHNETWQCQGYYESISMFVNDVLLAQQEMQNWPVVCDAGGEIY